MVRLNGFKPLPAPLPLPFHVGCFCLPFNAKTREIAIVRILMWNSISICVLYIYNIIYIYFLSLSITTRNTYVCEFAFHFLCNRKRLFVYVLIFTFIFFSPLLLFFLSFLFFSCALYPIACGNGSFQFGANCWILHIRILIFFLFEYMSLGITYNIGIT